MAEEYASETTMSIYPIIGSIFAVITVLIIIAAIIFVSDPDHITSNSVSSQLSYIASLDQGENTQISINLPDKDISVRSLNNEVGVITESSNEIKKNYIGQKEISSASNNVIIIN